MTIEKSRCGWLNSNPLKAGNIWEAETETEAQSHGWEKKQMKRACTGVQRSSPSEQQKIVEKLQRGPEGRTQALDPRPESALKPH